jgi:hypothetical protein
MLGRSFHYDDERRALPSRCNKIRSSSEMPARRINVGTAKKKIDCALAYLGTKNFAPG